MYSLKVATILGLWLGCSSITALNIPADIALRDITQASNTVVPDLNVTAGVIFNDENGVFVSSRVGSLVTILSIHPSAVRSHLVSEYTPLILYGLNSLTLPTKSSSTRTYQPLVPLVN